MAKHRIADILLVEDDPLDVRIFNRAAERIGFPLPVRLACDGDDALRQLRAAEEERGRAETLVVTDINMPGLTGHELMEDVRKDERLRNTIFFVLSSSDQTKDVAQAYDNGAAGYIVKGASTRSVEGCLEMLKAYCASVSLP